MRALAWKCGSGKSTILYMIPRIYDTLKGKVEIDGQNIKVLNLKSLRKQIFIVDQNTTLFDDTVFNNIKYAKPNASDEEIYNAAKLSLCETFINNFNDGFETKIG